MAQTPLHVAAGYNNIEIVKLLLGWRGPEKVEMEAKNMVQNKLFNLHCFCTFLKKQNIFVDSLMHLLLMNWEVWRNSIAYGSKEWV